MRAWAVVFVLLAAAGTASADSVHTISVPGATAVEAPAVTRLGQWEVSVAFDPQRCKITCVYRVRRDRLGRTPSYDILMPPALAIQVHFGPRRETLTVDPARTQDPTAASDPLPELPTEALPAYRAALTRTELALEAAHRPPAAPLPSSPLRPATTTLRI